MESTARNQYWKTAAAVFAALALGFILGIYLYPRFSGAPAPQNGAGSEKEQSVESESSPETVHITSAAQKEVGITAENAGYHNFKNTLTATGTIREDPGCVAHIRPLARGIIEKTFVRLGDRVAKGDPLVAYDNIELGPALGEYRTAQSELQRSLTDLEVRRTMLDRGRGMLKAGAIARTAYDLREAEYKDAEARVAGARATLAGIAGQIRRFGWTDEDLQASSQQQQNHGNSHTVIKAPSSGIITNLHASTGEAIEPSTELLSITDMSSLWVLADIFEKDLAYVRTGKAVQVQVASYPGKTFPGRITYIADAIDPQTRTAKVRCVVENNSGLFKLEMFATVSIPVDGGNSVLAVPDSAIQQMDGKPVVFIKKSGEEFRKRPIRTGQSNSGYTEICDGISADEQVVTQGSFIVKTAFLRHRIGEDE